MPVKEQFIGRRITKTQIDEYFERELQKAGYSDLDIQKTPLGTRVIIHAARPGLVIGKRGKNIRLLTTYLEENFKIENPQLEVAEIDVPELNAKVMAQRLASRLEKGTHYRRAAYSVLRRVKSANAKGIEITISGKLTSHRAKYKKFREGFVAKCGEPSNIHVDKAVAYAIMKKGVIGVKVKIMYLPENVILPNEIIIKSGASEAQEIHEE